MLDIYAHNQTTHEVQSHTANPIKAVSKTTVLAQPATTATDALSGRPSRGDASVDKLP